MEELINEQDSLKRMGATLLQQHIDLVRTENEARTLATGRQPLAHTQTYGCQQNYSDTEKLDALLVEMGYAFALSPEEADIVLYNTCAVREGAETRVFGNIGALKQAKTDNPDMIIALCGCMTQQEHVAQRIKTSYPFVDILFGASVMHRLPELIHQHRTQKSRVFSIDDPTHAIQEGLPALRNSEYKAWLPIMTGCNNFCSYCIVPTVRGRERSRAPSEIVKEAQSLIAQGTKEITLLGQNVNSYGKTLEKPVTFTELLTELSDIPGDFLLRFMTSHPKDCTHELIDLVAERSNIVKHIHLPVQSGSNMVLKAMNRGYSIEEYRRLMEYIVSKDAGITVTSDIIVGFPSETEDDFLQTLQLVEDIHYTALYTYIYSPREGTVAPTLPDPIPLSEKKRWFTKLVDYQNQRSKEYHHSLVGKTVRVLLDSMSTKNPGFLSGRTQSDVIVNVDANEKLLGCFVNVCVTQAHHWAVIGEITP